MGVWAATRVNGPVDHACRALVTVSAAFPTFFVGLLFVYVFYFLLGWAPQPLGRLNEIAFSPPPHVTGAYTVDALIAGDWPVLRGVIGPADAARDIARPVRAGADRAHHAGGDAGGAGQRLHPYRARQRPAGAQDL